MVRCDPATRTPRCFKELLMSSIKGGVKKKHFCIGRNFSCLMTSECWLSHIADSSFSCYYPVALSDTLGHDANEDQVLVSPLIGMWLFALWPGGHDRPTTRLAGRVIAPKPRTAVRQRLLLPKTTPCNLPWLPPAAKCQLIDINCSANLPRRMPCLM